MRALHHFHGGIHPEEHKLESSGLPIARAPLPQRLTLPLQQHLGSRAKAVVQAGDRVLKGQLLARAEGEMSAAVHAPTSGLVLSVDLGAVPHPSGLPDLCATIEPDGEERWIERATLDFCALPKAELLVRLRDGGIVGLGGATFPAHLKFDLKPAQAIRTLVLNGAECEPWITSDDRLMRERAAEIVQGIEILRHLVNPAETLVGIEDNKPQAIAAMRQACANTGIEVAAIPTLYPTGGEKQLIKVLTGKEVPSGGYPLHIGVLCSNVATAYAVHRLVNCGEPVISRLVTVTGNVRTPQNFEALLGTPIEDLTKLAGGALPGSADYILGGPMMGLHTSNGRLPVVKSTNCIIVKSPQLFPPLPPALPCIRCTRCADACPADLQPQELYWFAQARNFDKIRNYHLFDCIECGACNYVCPSHIPLAQYFRFAKSEIRALEHESAAAALARERYEFRQMRIERDKQEKAEKLAQKEKAALAARQPAAAPVAPQDSSTQARIQAALERAKAQAAAVTPKNMDALTPQQQAEIAEIEARRARARELAQAQDIPHNSNNAD
ncbi:MAG: electron transport complex subunit RsxC [Nitrosomonadales bacterium]|nr:electron transport complex subunit RsxC [Nitrosomonadales bacterium]